jgi:hypothetical protein
VEKFGWMNPMDENDIAAVRRVRHEISAECNHDVEQVVAYYRSVQEELKCSGEFKFKEPSIAEAADSPVANARPK